MEKYNRLISFIAIILFVFSSCTSTKKSGIKNENSYPETNLVKPIIADTNFAYNAAQQYILGDSNFLSAHVGISIYNPETQQYLYNYQGDKYFVPASNMKLFTCYAAMKNLGDSLVGLRYFNDNGNYVLQATGDPTFLHDDFKNQPVFNFFKSKPRATFLINNWDEKPLGSGWAWNDYGDYYMAERSAFPIYGNTVKFNLDKKTGFLNVLPSYFNTTLFYKEITLLTDSFNIKRGYDHNNFKIERSNSKFKSAEIPFITDKLNIPIGLLNDIIESKFEVQEAANIKIPFKISNIIHSQPTDSLLKPMMRNSDNFFAEQTLLMVSNEKLGVMNDEKIIDTLLKTDFKGLPQKPKWVDGSGLSRYNLITPQDFVWVLTKMKNDFSWQRITNILATGNEGTLNNYYKNLSGKIFAKTGTLSNQVALSGYFITKQNKTLVFSVLVNNHQTSATAIRRGVEQFLNSIWDKY